MLFLFFLVFCINCIVLLAEIYTQVNQEKNKKTQFTNVRNQIEVSLLTERVRKCNNNKKSMPINSITGKME